jgi:hypothetical protein
MDLGKLFSKVVKTVKDSIEAEQRQTTTSPQPKSTPQPATTTHYEQEKERTDAEWLIYFREILATEFVTYNVRENVPVTDVAGFANDEFQLYQTRPRQVYKAEWGQPYTFLLEQGGSPKGVVMLGKGNSHNSKVKYLIARMYAKKLGIPYINFYTQMPNERDYVIGRIRKFLN